jgi:hypothetical protein
MLTPLEPIDRLADLIQPQRGQAAEPREAAVRLSEAEWLLWVDLGPSLTGQLQTLTVVQVGASQRQYSHPGVSRAVGRGDRSVSTRRTLLRSRAEVGV